MTLVNTETGELVDTEVAERRASYICTDLDSAASSFETAMTRMREAIHERDDMALGYRSPADYLTDRFGSRLARLGVDLRREVVRELTEAGMSVRAIAAVADVSVGTIHNDQRQVFNSEHLTQTPADAAGAAPSVELAPKVAPAEEEVTAAAVETSTEDATATTPEAGTPAITRPPVVGIDGKTYSRPAPTPKPASAPHDPDYDNAVQACLGLTRAMSRLLTFEHPNMRAGMRTYWAIAADEVPPIQRRDVTPELMRAAARGLLELADEWESQ